MQKKTLFVMLILFFASICQAQEDITITTYYPSPYGSYNELYVASRLGIGTESPQTALDVVGTTRTVGFQMPTAATDGYVLTSDAAGSGTWQPKTISSNCTWRAGSSSGYDCRSISGSSSADNCPYMQCLPGEILAGVMVADDNGEAVVHNGDLIGYCCR